MFDETRREAGYKCMACNDDGIIHSRFKDFFPEYSHLFRDPSDYGQACQRCGNSHKYPVGLLFNIPRELAEQFHRLRVEEARQAYAKYNKIKLDQDTEKLQTQGAGIYEYNPEEEVDF